MTDLLSLLYEAAGDFDELEDPRSAKKQKTVAKASSPSSNAFSGPQSIPSADHLARPRSMSNKVYSSSPFTRSTQQPGVIFGFEERDQSTNGGSPPSPSGSMESSSVTSTTMDEREIMSLVGMIDEFASSETDDDDGVALHGSHHGMAYNMMGGMMDGSPSSSAPSSSDASSLSHLLNSKKRKRVTKQSSRRAKPLTVEILFQIFEKLNIQKELINGTYKLVLPTLKSAECSSIYFAVTEWQCFRKRIMNHGFEIVDEQQSSWIRVRPNLASPDGRLIFEDLELRRRYGTPCKIKNARERSEVFELPPLDQSEIARIDSPSRVDSPSRMDATKSLPIVNGDSEDISSPSSTNHHMMFEKVSQNNMMMMIGGTKNGGICQQIPSSSLDMSSSYSASAAAAVSLQTIATAAVASSAPYELYEAEARKGASPSTSGGMSGVASGAPSSPSSSSPFSAHPSPRFPSFGFGNGAASNSNIGGGEGNHATTQTPSLVSIPLLSAFGSSSVSSPSSSSRRTSFSSFGAGGNASAASANGMSSTANTSTSFGMGSPLMSGFLSSMNIHSPSSSMSFMHSRGILSGIGTQSGHQNQQQQQQQQGEQGEYSSSSSSSDVFGFPSSSSNAPSLHSSSSYSPHLVFGMDVDHQQQGGGHQQGSSNQSSPRNGNPNTSISSPQHNSSSMMSVEPTQQLEGALRHCLPLPLVARELLSSGHFSLSNGQFDIQVTMKPGVGNQAGNQVNAFGANGGTFGQFSSFGSSPSSAASSSFGQSPISFGHSPRNTLPLFPPFSVTAEAKANQQ
jgi:hypothetical protein